MLTGKEECSRCGHLRAVHGAPRDRRGLGCLMHVKTGGGRIGCSCPEFVLYETKDDEFLTPSDNPVLTVDALRAVFADSALAPGTRVTYTQKLQAPDDFDGKTGTVVEVATRKIEGHTPVIYDHMPHLVAWPATEYLLPSVLPSVEDASLALGDRVLFRRPLVRRRSTEEQPVPEGEQVGPYSYMRRIHRRDWVRNEHVTMWRQGIVIGKRTLQNGRYNYGGGDEQSYLTDIEYVPAYLIAYDLHQKPVRVLEDDIKRL